jgi:hypothetical protein
MAAKNEDPAAAVERTDTKSANLGNPNTGVRRDLAEDLPEKDEVQVAYKTAMTADSMQAEVKAKVDAVDASPNAADTPSGYALKKTAGIANDTERGEEYARVKAARRWGAVTPDLKA